MPSKTAKMRKDPTSEGRRSVMESLKDPSRVERVSVRLDLRNSDSLQNIILRCEDNDIPLDYIDENSINKLSYTGKHQGVIAHLVSAGYFPEAKFWSLAEKERLLGMNLLVLDGIHDPQNFGAMARSALALGIHYIIIPKKRSVGITAGAIRASAGAIHGLSIVRVANISNFLARIKKYSFWIVGLKSGSYKSIREHKFSERVALVIGSEHKGLSGTVEKEVDIFVSIPINIEKIDSLNASVAASIAMFELDRNSSY